MSSPRLDTVPAAATYADVSEGTIWRLLRVGILTRYRVGVNRARVDLNEIDALLAPVAVPREAGAK